LALFFYKFDQTKRIFDLRVKRTIELDLSRTKRVIDGTDKFIPLLYSFDGTQKYSNVMTNEGIILSG